MISLDNEAIFKEYYQANYDFNTSALKEEEIDDIKILVKEKRVNYAQAPIGDKIFDLIMDQHPNLRFELVKLDNENINGMLYIPKNGEDKAYIIINGNKPFINQIFTAAHEFYHYIRDYEIIKKKPYICCLSSLKDINEKKASRFAAELLLPEEALKQEVRNFKKRINILVDKNFSFGMYAYLSILLTIKYELPLKAVIYRLHEEGYIGNIDQFIDNYDVIKCLLKQTEIFQKDIKTLYNHQNRILDNVAIVYQQIEVCYKRGLASREEIIKDIDLLDLNKEIIESFFDEINVDDEEEEDDLEILDFIQKKRGGE